MKSRSYWRILLALTLSVTSCATSTTIPPSAYRSENGHSYRVHTTDGTTYYVSDFTSDDSTLTILRFRDVGNHTEAVPKAPLQIPLHDVKSVESVNKAGKSSMIGIGVFAAVIVIGSGLIAVSSLND
jgi:hypothetical protein